MVYHCAPVLTEVAHRVKLTRMRAGETEVIPGVVGPVEFRQDITEPTSGHVVTVLVRFDEELRRYACDEVKISRDGRPAPISTETLRRLPLADMIRGVIRVALLVNGQPTALRDQPPAGGVEPWGRVMPEGLAKEGPTDRVLRWVAHFYRLSVALDEPQPTATVQELMGVSRATAGRWVTAARDRGFLGAALRGRPGER